MGTALLTIVLAPVIGWVGLLDERLRRPLVIGFVPVLAGFVTGEVGRSRRTSD